MTKTQAMHGERGDTGKGSIHGRLAGWLNALANGVSLAVECFVHM